MINTKYNGYFTEGEYIYDGYFTDFIDEDEEQYIKWLQYLEHNTEDHSDFWK